jgi:hypothetical protein
MSLRRLSETWNWAGSEWVREFYENRILPLVFLGTSVYKSSKVAVLLNF